MDSNTTPRLLIVEDEPRYRDLLCSFFMGHGYSVLSADHGQAAIERLRETPCDVIISDLIMPVMGGFGLLSALRAEQHPGACIVLTAFFDPATRQRLLELGAYECIDKFSSEEQLTDVVSKALEHRVSRKTIGAS